MQMYDEARKANKTTIHDAKAGKDEPISHAYPLDLKLWSKECCQRRVVPQAAQARGLSGVRGKDMFELRSESTHTGSFLLRRLPAAPLGNSTGIEWAFQAHTTTNVACSKDQREGRPTKHPTNQWSFCPILRPRDWGIRVFACKKGPHWNWKDADGCKKWC